MGIVGGSVVMSTVCCNRRPTTVNAAHLAHERNHNAKPISKMDGEIRSGLCVFFWVRRNPRSGSERLIFTKRCILNSMSGRLRPSTFYSAASA